MCMRRYYVTRSVPGARSTLIGGRYIEIDPDDPGWGAYLRAGILIPAEPDEDWPTEPDEDCATDATDDEAAGPEAIAEDTGREW